MKTTSALRVLAPLAALSCVCALAALAQPPAKPEIIKRPALTAPRDSAARPQAISPDSMERRVQRALGQPVGAITSADNGPPIDVNIPMFWRTRAERTNWRTTSDYDETMRFCRQLEAGTRWVRLTTYGKSGQGRDLPLLIVSKDRAFTPEAARATGKPVVLIQNGIHSGEIEGKDACLSLVRDLAVLRQHDELLDSCTVLILPIFSVDAHERRSRYNRINQNGPEEMGWRHTPIGLNLNRDYMKAEAPEMRALLSEVYTKWWPELLIDDHTTDGADYQHDVTYAYPHGADCPPAIDAWFRDAFEGRIVPRITALGHLPAPYLNFRGGDPRNGIEFGESLPRFSTNYPPLQARAAVLVETHMLKPYGVRVRATYDLLLAVLEELHARPRALTSAVQRAEAAAMALGSQHGDVVLNTKLSDKAERFAYRGKVAVYEDSPITGGKVPRYTSAPFDTLVPLYRDVVATLRVPAPAGYLIPQEWSDVIDLLQVHGVTMRRLTRAWRDSVDMTRILEWSSEPAGFEGHHPIRVTKTRTERQLRAFRAGDVWVPCDQRGGALVVNLLEAQAPDGVLAWNAFDTIFQRKEYGEDYVVEPIAREMLAKDPKLAAEFAAKVAADTTFAKNPYARIDWFYRRSPWADPEQDLMPVARVAKALPEGLFAPAAAPAPAAPRR